MQSHAQLSRSHIVTSGRSGSSHHTGIPHFTDVSFQPYAKAEHRIDNSQLVHVSGGIMRISFLSALLLIGPSIFGQSPASFPPLVSPEWLKQHLQDPDLVVLHVGFGRKDYLREHVPGARFMWFNWLCPSTPDESTIMAPVAAADSILEQAGISDNSRVVVYFTSGNVSTTTRIMFALLFFGFEDRAALLDGGLDGWKRAGGAITKDVPTVARGSLTLHSNTSIIADAGYVLSHLSDPSVTIVDARGKNFYDGGSAGSARTGHIRGAISIPFSTLVDSLNTFKSTTELKSLFDRAGYKKGSTVVAYCHVGQQATVVLEACRLLNIDYKLYDGSFEDWGALDDRYPAEITPVKEK
ncbi:MAG: hypothetical protein A3H45_01240 [Ignavibacteria bacterium RIFCSPLOWO2_02_FULL_55_14]|nr:MAG: hypothetical protein A2X68_12255 [Ignavibacteria bacterium GWC2_56_12]OGU72713.1 MAG: hypothetical protein A3G43_05960 [Ignavibacteria bacterium RIFCSPLOWO2_12_FULL_56_21]OGU75198.1 MAG: hypothetical protein A3H45_01240 [Ignavibacteria bacterium RIFCSPLOWO2_02_FULL_55_14]